MADRVTFSGEHRSLPEIFEYYADAEVALKEYFSFPAASSKFLFLSQNQLSLELQKRLLVHNRSGALQVMASLEAAFRIDYLKRVYERDKDDLSKAMRILYKKKGARVSLEDEIFELWAEHTSMGPQLLGDLKAAFKYRHWLAHGQYWTPKLGRRYNYGLVANLAQAVLNGFPLLS